MCKPSLAPANPTQAKCFADGIPIPVRLRVSRVRWRGEELLLDREFSHHTRETGGSSPAVMITRMRLPRGQCRFRIEALQNTPELVGTPVRFQVHVRVFK